MQGRLAWAKADPCLISNARADPCLICTSAACACFLFVFAACRTDALWRHARPRCRSWAMNGTQLFVLSSMTTWKTNAISLAEVRNSSKSICVSTSSNLFQHQVTFFSYCHGGGRREHPQPKAGLQSPPVVRNLSGCATCPKLSFVRGDYPSDKNLSKRETYARTSCWLKSIFDVLHQGSCHTRRTSSND